MCSVIYDCFFVLQEMEKALMGLEGIPDLTQD